MNEWERENDKKQKKYFIVSAIYAVCSVCARIHCVSIEMFFWSILVKSVVKPCNSHTKRKRDSEYDREKSTCHEWEEDCVWERQSSNSFVRSSVCSFNPSVIFSIHPILVCSIHECSMSVCNLKLFFSLFSYFFS